MTLENCGKFSTVKSWEENVQCTVLYGRKHFYTSNKFSSLVWNINTCWKANLNLLKAKKTI